MASFKIPGVYSEIDPSAAVQSVGSNSKVIGIIAKGSDTKKEFAGKAYAPFSFTDAKEKYGEDSNICKLMQTAIKNEASKFIVFQVEEDKENPKTYKYDAALELAEAEEGVYILITDSLEETFHTKIKEHIKVCSEDRKERIAFLGLDKGSDITAAITKGTQTNSSRVIIPYPNGLDEKGEEISGIFTAAALAGIVAAEIDPSLPFTGVEMLGFFGLTKKLKNEEMEALIDAGITPLQSRNGNITIVRAITTYTKNSQNATDITWQELTTVTISDYLFKDLRNSLSVKYRRAKQNKKSRDRLKSDVLTNLKTYEGLEYIENVENNDVEVEVNPTNPTMNDVRFKYDVVTPMNVIRLIGHLVI